jgi:ankyrin repeat protein
MSYKIGLNINIEKFNPSGDCEPGGIYFAREDILAFLDYGPWIRKVTIPEDARVYENPGTPKKWKADRIILGKRERISLNVIKRLIEEGANLKAKNSYILQWAIGHNHVELVKILIPFSNKNDDHYMIFHWATKYGHIEIVKMLLEKGTDPKIRNSYPLQLAAQNGHIEVVKLLLPLSNPKADDSLALRWAAKHGHIKIVKLLLPLSDPKTDDSLALRWAAQYGHIEIVKLLLPVSDITKYCLQYINHYCDDKEILDLVNNYQKGDI